MSELRRGDIWIVNFDPTIGHEIKKTRPAIIIQNNVGNSIGPITIVAPITSQKIDYIRPFDAFIKKTGGLDKDSKAVLNQIRSIDKRRLVKKIGSLDENTLGKVDEALKISLGLVDL